METAKIAMTGDRWIPICCGGALLSQIPIYQISNLARCETWNWYFLAKSQLRIVRFESPNLTLVSR